MLAALNHPNIAAIFGLEESAGVSALVMELEKSIATLGPEHLPSASMGPALRMTLNPDGTSLTYSTRTTIANLWLIDGLNTVTSDDRRD